MELYVGAGRFWKVSRMKVNKSGIYLLAHLLNEQNHDHALMLDQSFSNS